MLTHTKDVLRKTTYTAPIDGIVSYIAVRVGENVVPGIQNAEGSFLMTISDMSVVTAEVKVDETDITNVREGKPADVTIDAIPGKVFKGHVTEVGELAILRTSGQAATTQTTANTQEARDFKVVVTLDNPPADLRPGLSATREDSDGAEEKRADDSDSGAGGALAERVGRSAKGAGAATSPSRRRSRLLRPTRSKRPICRASL